MTKADVLSHERRVDTPNGQVFVREMPGEDPPIVLMHGFPDDHRVYDKLFPRLSPRRAVAFDWLGYRTVLVGHDASGPDAVAFAVAHPERVAQLVLLNTVFGHQPAMKLPEMIRLFADPALAPLADAMVDDEGQRLWLLQHTATQWGLDALDPDGIAIQSVLPQFFGDADQPDALVAVRAWTAGLFDALEQEDAFIDSGALGHLEVPVSIVFGEDDRYLNPSLAAEIAGLFKNPSFHLVPDASHWPQHDQPELVAQLLTR
jgi:pimeloyl-ACP methyl ester carboxylesterase